MVCPRQPYSLFHHLCWGLLGVRDPERTWVLAMAEFALYLDDGGHPDDQPYLAVAGYVATESDWQAFEPQWKAAIANIPGVDVAKGFHMTDFMRERMTSFKRDLILSALATITKNRTIRPFVCACDIDAWKRVNREFALEECHGAPFAIAMRGLQKELRQWEAENLGPNDQLLTFVEEGTKHIGQMQQILKRDGIPIPVPVPKTMPQVQPADILAWEAFNWMRSGKPEARMGKNLNRLTRAIRKKQWFGAIFYESDLRDLCRETNVNKRADLRPGDTIRFHNERKRVRQRTIT